jgi:hypothetical protein
MNWLSIVVALLKLTNFVGLVTRLVDNYKARQQGKQQQTLESLNASSDMAAKQEQVAANAPANKDELIEQLKKGNL